MYHEPGMPETPFPIIKNLKTKNRQSLELQFTNSVKD